MSVKNPIIFKNKFSLVLKLFIMVWVVLIVHVILKLTFNYWQPYVIPNEQLQIISDFIDNNSWLKILLNGILYLTNGILVMLCCLKRWWFKNKIHTIIVISAIVLGFIYNLITGDGIINSLIITVLLPLILDKSKWLYIILTFVFSNLFMVLSLVLEGFVNTDNMQYICKTFLQLDYYIMLTLNYFVFNFIRKREVKE